MKILGITDIGLIVPKSPPKGIVAPSIIANHSNSGWRGLSMSQKVKIVSEMIYTHDTRSLIIETERMGISSAELDHLLESIFRDPNTVLNLFGGDNLEDY